MKFIQACCKIFQGKFKDIGGGLTKKKDFVHFHIFCGHKMHLQISWTKLFNSQNMIYFQTITFILGWFKIIFASGATSFFMT